MTSGVPGHTTRHAGAPDLRRRRLGHRGFAVIGPLAPLGTASYPVLVHRRAVSLPASSPRMVAHLAVAVRSARDDLLTAGRKSSEKRSTLSGQTARCRSSSGSLLGQTELRQALFPTPASTAADGRPAHCPRQGQRHAAATVFPEQESAPRRTSERDGAESGANRPPPLGHQLASPTVRFGQEGSKYGLTIPCFESS